MAFGTAAATAAGRAATEGVTRALTPSARIPEIVGKTVTEAAGGVPAATPAPIPSVPLNLAQTTARPEVASALDVLNAQNVPAMQAERSAQNTAMVNAISGQAAGEPALHAPAAVGGAQVPEVIAGRGSTAATGAVQQAAKIIASEEGRVWNKPSLTEPRVSSETGKRLVEAEVRALRRDQPGLALALDESAALQRTIRELELMPEKAAANQLNAISSRFRRIARDPGEAADVRLVATRLANAAQEGIWQAPEVAGRAPATQAELEAATAAQQPAAPVRPAWAGGAPPGRAPLHGEVLGRGDLWRSTPEQLEQMLAEKEASDEEKLVRALGSKERADRFNRLDRAQNSSNPDRADRAKKQMDEEFGQLTPEQERLIYGIGESDASAEDIRQVLAAAGEHNSNPADAAYQAALAMRGVPARQIQAVQAGGGSAAAQAAFVRLGNAYSDMVAAGVPRERIPNLIVSSLVRQGWSEPDAQEVIGHALAGFQRATAPAQAAGPARAALPSPGIGAGRAPRRPQTFLDAVVRAGGVKPDADLRAMNADLYHHRQGGRLLNPKGMTPNQLREFAVQEGFARQGETDEQVAKEMIRDGLNGVDHYRPEDLADADYWRQIDEHAQREMYQRDANMTAVRDVAEQAGVRLSPAMQEHAAELMLRDPEMHPEEAARQASMAGEDAALQANANRLAFGAPGVEPSARTTPLPDLKTLREGVAPDPELVRDLKAARAFTRREAETLGHASFDNILRRNSRGNETVIPGTAMSRFFDFTNGVERPGDIKNVSRFLDDIRSEWLKLSAEERGHTFDPETIAPVKQQLEEGARNYIFGKMLDAISSKEMDVTGNRMIQYRQAVDWLNTNRDMLERSGSVHA